MRSRLHAAAIGLGLFLLVWGGKLVVIDHWGSDLPWWDDWDAIGDRVLVPHAQGRLGFAQLIAPHNEHRILCTRLLDLALVVANGQWDARLECAVNAALHALIAVGAFLAGRRMLTPFAQLGWFAVLAAFTAPPVVWENIIRGFDSQHYFLIGFSFATIALLTTSAPGTARWWAGIASAILALFTMASGVVAVVVVALVLGATTPWRELWRRQRWTLLACALVAALGAALHHVVPGGEAMRAHTFDQFFTALMHHLQWPLVRHASFAAISYMPWLWLAWRSVRGRATGTVLPGERVVVAIGLWALVHYAAMAFMRGSFQPWPPTRGLENVVVGLLANFYVVILAWSRVRLASARALEWLSATVSIVGVAVCFHGLVSIIRENTVIVLPALAAKARLAETNTRAFLTTGDAAWLKPGEIPYPDAGAYASVVSRPQIQAVLPPSVRMPNAIAGPTEIGPLSIIARALGRGGWWVVFAGVVFSAIGWSRKPRAS